MVLRQISTLWRRKLGTAVVRRYRRATFLTIPIMTKREDAVWAESLVETILSPASAVFLFSGSWRWATSPFSKLCNWRVFTLSVARLTLVTVPRTATPEVTVALFGAARDWGFHAHRGLSPSHRGYFGRGDKREMPYGRRCFSRTRPTWRGCRPFLIMMTLFSTTWQDDDGRFNELSKQKLGCTEWTRPRGVEGCKHHHGADNGGLLRKRALLLTR